MTAEATSRPLPAGWRWVRLVEVGRFESGGTPSKNNASYWNGAIPFVTGADITEMNISAKHARAFLTAAGLATGKTAVCQPGTILFVTRTRVGRVGIATETMGASQDLSPYICNPEMHPEYVCRYLMSISQYLLQKCRGATIQGLTRDSVHSLKIPLPPLAEQKRIAAILNEQMAVVEEARAAAEAQLAAAKSLPAAYLCAVFNGPEAQQWPAKRLEDVCEIQLGKMLSPASKVGVRLRPYLRNANVQWGRIDFFNVAQMDFTEEEENKFALRRGDLLVCEGGEPGRAAVWNGEIAPCYYQKALHRLRPKDRAVDSNFVMYHLWMGALQGEFLESHAKTTIAHLPAIRLSELPIGIPLLADQHRIAARLSEQMAAAERTCKMLEDQLAALNALPASLLRRAFSGGL